MLDFIQQNYVTIVMAFIILIAIIVHIAKYEKDVLRKAALYAVSKAEDEWLHGTGKIKFAQVYVYLKRTYPIITFFISEDRLSKLIEDSLETLKKVIEERSGDCEDELLKSEPPKDEDEFEEYSE